LVVVDLLGRVVRWNHALENIYGIAAAEATGHKLEEVFDGPFVEALRAAQKTGDLAGMNAVINDEILDHFLVQGSWAEMPERIAQRVAPLRAAGLDVQPVLYHAGLTYRTNRPTFDRFGALAAALRDY